MPTLRETTLRGAMPLAVTLFTTGCCLHLEEPLATPLVGHQAVQVPLLALVVVLPLASPQAGHLVLHLLDLHMIHHGGMIRLARRRWRAR